MQKIDEGLQYEDDADGVTYREHDERVAKKRLIQETLMSARRAARPGSPVSEGLALSCRIEMDRSHPVPQDSDGHDMPMKP